MAEDQLQQFLEKVSQLNAFVALSEAEPSLRQALRDCSDHYAVVALARSRGFEIGRRWGETIPPRQPEANLLATPCPAEGQEISVVLVDQTNWRLERIHSCEAASPEGFWYDQEEHEWVNLLQGRALLEIAGEAEPLELCRGDSLLIPAHQQHRLLATDPAPGTVWLALFWREAGEY